MICLIKRRYVAHVISRYTVDCCTHKNIRNSIRTRFFVRKNYSDIYKNALFFFSVRFFFFLSPFVSSFFFFLQWPPTHRNRTTTCSISHFHIYLKQTTNSFGSHVRTCMHAFTQNSANSLQLEINRLICPSLSARRPSGCVALRAMFVGY